MGGVFKILVTGPFNSGKTTFIRTISEIEVVSTERRTRLSSGKLETTTVAMDFGRITLPDGNVIHLYGTPGQERFDFMWEVLSEGMLGFVLLVDGSDPDTFGEAVGILERFRSFSDEPFVVGVTRPDSPRCAAAQNVRRALSRAFDGVPDVKFMRCDARKRIDVKRVLIELLGSVLERLEAKDAAWQTVP